MNLDFADIKAIMMGGGVCAVGFGEGHGGTKVEDAVMKAIDNQLLDVDDVSKAQGALVHVEGGEDMTLEDINRAGEMVLESVSKDARVVWGSKINPNLEGKIRATVVLAGVDSPFLLRQDKGAMIAAPSKPKVIKIKSQKTAE